MTFTELMTEVWMELGMPPEEIRERHLSASFLVPSTAVEQPIVFKPGIDEAEAIRQMKENLKKLWPRLQTPEAQEALRAELGAHLGKINPLN